MAAGGPSGLSCERGAGSCGSATRTERTPRIVDWGLYRERNAVERLVGEARRQMEDAAFRRDRLQAAVTRLQERLNELRAQEEDARRWAAYRKAEAERDKLAAELAEVYPAFAERLAALLPRIATNDREIDHINAHALPSGSAGSSKTEWRRRASRRCCAYRPSSRRSSIAMRGRKGARCLDRGWPNTSRGEPTPGRR